MLPNGPVSVTVIPNTYIYLVLLLFLIPGNWLIAWLTALSVHEFCHWAAVKACSGRIYEIMIGIGGVKMRCSTMSNAKQLFCILSGPFGGLLLVLLSRWLPRTALCSWILSMYNLLPFSFLDGGKSLEILFGKGIVTIVERVFLVFLSITALYAAISLEFGFLPLMIIAGLWLKSGKKPCKPRICKVQ